MNHEEIGEDQENIAIVGIAVRMPGAPDLESFWQNLRDGVEAVSLFSEAEMLASGLDLETIRDPLFVPAKAILDDVEMFDAPFFGISPREAELMDPQHRLMMECAWEVLEHAGYDSETYPGRIAVFTSAGMNTYLPFNILSNPGLLQQVGGFQLSIYNDKDFVPSRIAYSMNLKGPAIDIGTACSSSLVGVHFACQHLLTYQSDMTLVGGISIHLPEKMGHLYEAGTAYSPDSHCRPFDAEPSGLIDGNGVAAVVLKRLSEALADGDRIYAVIKGSAINNDGAAKVGYSAPSINGQAEVIVEAQAVAGVSPATISYVETHGTATPLGDPIEVAALTQAFRAGTDKKGYCGIGSVKSNIGHVDKAAGLAGLIKTALALDHGMIPPNLHFKQPNPKLNLADSPFYVVGSLQAWPRDPAAPRRAGISSFGVGGTNAHAILEEAPLPEPGSSSRPLQLMMISAKTDAALSAAAKNMAAFLEREPHINLADTCHTLQKGRRAFAHRRAFTCTSTGEAIKALRTMPNSHVDHQAQRGVVFMFPGQGSQYPGMGAELYLQEAVFREQIDLCAQILLPELGLDIRTLLFPNATETAAAAIQLKQTALAQPALFSIEYALARLWMSWGLKPYAMIGHSLGEYVAACIARVFSLSDALTLVAARSRLMQSMPVGAMLAVPMAEPALLTLLAEIAQPIDLAAVNGPELCVVSGPLSAIELLQNRLNTQGLSSRLLHTSHAFHSAAMQPILAPFTELLRAIELKPPQIPYLSNLTGTWISAAETCSPDYWAKHLRHSVRFGEGLAVLLATDATPVLLEVGPGRTLGGLAGLAAGLKTQPLCLSSLPQAQENRDAQSFLLRSLADLWLAGIDIDWNGFYRDERRLRVPLPTYPFQRRRYWIEAGKPVAGEAAKSTAGSRQANPADWFYLPSWKASLAPTPSASVSAWLVFADEIGLAETLTTDQAQNDRQIITVNVGAGFTRQHQRAYSINPTNPSDFDALLDALDRENALPRQIVYLWALSKPDAGATDLSRHCDPLLALIQALSRRPDGVPVELSVIGNGIRDVGANEPIDPGKASLLGLLRTLPWELPHLSAQAIDIPLPTTAVQLHRLASRLSRELSVEAKEPLLVLRNGYRWIPSLEAVRPDSPHEEVPCLLRNGGIYLITGGLEGIGLLFARHVAAMVQAKLILTTSASLDSIAVEQIRALEALGCEVLPLRLVDFDTPSLNSVLNQAEHHFGGLDGVIHAADMSSSRPFSLMQTIGKAEQDAYWQIQQQSLNALKQSLEQRHIEFCLLMSSLAAELGGIGQATHAVACVYLEAFARQHNQTGAYPWIVVQWDVWQEEGEAPGINSALADIAMTPQEGGNAFLRLMALGESTAIIIATSDPRFRRKALDRMSDTPATTQTSAAGKRHDRPDLDYPYQAPRNESEMAIAELWQEYLGIDKIGIHDNFFDLGGHSLLATQLVSRLQHTFKVDLELTLFFIAPTIAELSETLLKKQLESSDEDQLAEWLDKLEQMSEDEAQALLESGSLPAELLNALGH
ncbi:type I polyketide synthase [Methylomonas albis]|uniref:Acyltransferase domain-containing protein n=1 Tax=Methylomonas albis TaxID=1854563 RepID=A0ABR9D5G8_9GAMM|nr:type I polyketide synthase [Methylomonas albis]MBD9358031.1 acyltransferase domain-containing protein [Methylomonas albis]